MPAPRRRHSTQLIQKEAPMPVTVEDLQRLAELVSDLDGEEIMAQALS